TARGKWMSAVAVAIALAAHAVPAFSQWPSYPSGGPETPDGKPDLTAPTPRTTDGKPDLSGVWWLASRQLAFPPGGGRGGVGTAPAPSSPAPPSPEPPPPPPSSAPSDGPPLATFF